MYTKWFKRYLKYRMKLGANNSANYTGSILADMFILDINNKYYYINPIQYVASGYTDSANMPVLDFISITSVGSMNHGTYALCTNEKNELSNSIKDTCLVTLVSKSKTTTFDTTNNCFKITSTTILTSRTNQTAKSIIGLVGITPSASNTFTPTEAQIHCDDNDNFDGSIINSVSLSGTSNMYFIIKEFFNLDTPITMTSGTSYTINITKYVDVSGVVKETDITIV